MTADGALSRATAASVLHDLDKLYVHVAHVSPAASEAGIDPEALVRDASLALSRSGLIVLSAESYRPDTPFVSIALEAMLLPAGEMAFHASLELQEEVLLGRDSRVATLGSTWYTARLGLSSPTALQDDVSACVLAMVDDFLSEWSAGVP